jgi:N-acyl-L-homoserine lactone synthetase
MPFVLQGSQRRQYGYYFELMFALRHRVFIKQMNWNLPASQKEREIDEYDVDDAIYLVELTPDNHLQGTVRLTPTTTCSVVADIYPHLVENGISARSPLVYEATRYIFLPLSKTARENRAAKARLLGGMLKWCLKNKLTHVQGMVDMADFPHWVELVPQTIPLGLPHPYGGGPRVQGGGNCIAFRWPATQEVINGIYDYGAIDEEANRLIAAEDQMPLELLH